MTSWGPGLFQLPTLPPHTHTRDPLEAEIPQDGSPFGNTVKETPLETVACEESGLVKEVPRPQTKPAALSNSFKPNAFFHDPPPPKKIQFLGATSYNISQIGHPKMWETFGMYHIVGIILNLGDPRGTPRHSSEQLKWMSRAWGPLMGRH